MQSEVRGWRKEAKFSWKLGPTDRQIKTVRDKAGNELVSDVSSAVQPLRGSRFGRKSPKAKGEALSLDRAGIWGQMEESRRAVTSALVSESWCHVPVNV